MPRRAVIKVTALALLAALAGVLLLSNRSDESHASGYFPGQAGQAPAPDGITVRGVGGVRVERPSRRSDRTIQLAVAAAQRAAFGKALADARAHAEGVANALQRTAGSVQSVAESEDTYSAGVFGRFGAGRHCGTISRRIFGRDATGRRVLQRVVRRRTCIVPRQSVVVLTVRYEMG
jgi:hypothetical protein